MGIISHIARYVLTYAVLARGYLEVGNYDLTESLIKNGVNMSALPGITELSRNSPRNPCSLTCKYLEIVFGNNKVIMRGEQEYDSVRMSYWAEQQASIEPSCIFTPEKSLDISTFILLSQCTQCPFAVKSGGHATFAGASSISHGITVSMEKMKKMSVSPDKKTVSIEPGNTWLEVYGRLTEHRLAVTGGRLVGIGVGGLTLGGGFSHHVNSHGFACDNVASYDIVIASGDVVQVSQTSSPDLYWALRGGGNNFGIVTAFHMKSFTQGPMWGGYQIHNETNFPALIEAFYNVGKNSAQDTKAAHFLLFQWDSTTHTPTASANLHHADPIPDTQIFAEYRAVPAIQTNFSVQSLYKHTTTIESPNGKRRSFWTATFKLDRIFALWTANLFFEEFGKIASRGAISPAMDFQIISEPQIKQTTKAGGNPLGLSSEDGPLLVVLLFPDWLNVEDDEKVDLAIARFSKRLFNQAKKKKLAREYLYMPYAGPYQAVIPSYGKENQQRLKQIAKRYDPAGVFQKLQPGHFKLEGSPYGGKGYAG